MKYYKSNWSWGKSTDVFLSHQLIGFTLNFPCGKSRLGNIRVDLDRELKPDVIADLNFPPFKNGSFDTVLCDPPFSFYNKIRWVWHLADLAKKRVIVSSPPIHIKLGRSWQKSIFCTDTGLRFMRIFQVFSKIELQ